MSEHEISEQGFCQECKSPSYAGHTPGCPANAGFNKQQHEEKMTASRDSAQKEWKDRAREQNSYRTLWKKIFGIEKTGAMDIAMEEAMKMDKKIEWMMQEGKAKSISEAVEIASQQNEFEPKTKDKTEKEEFLRPFILEIGKFIESNHFSVASMIEYDVGCLKGVDDEMRQMLKEVISPLIDKKIIECIKSKDGKSFLEAFMTYKHEKIDKIKKDNNINELGLSEEELRAPEIVNAVKERLIDSFERFCIMRIPNRRMLEFIVEDKKQFGIDNFVIFRDEMVKTGIVSKEEINGLEKIKNRAKILLVNTLRHYGIAYFEVRRDQMIEAGIVSGEEAENWPEIIELREKAK